MQMFPKSLPLFAFVLPAVLVRGMKMMLPATGPAAGSIAVVPVSAGR